ncbi:MAG: hypothetical protein JW889_14475 [Verrucomicrobia bacterium]|nr:hypothetical protein [Verrucomicrobiota bacterium]
MDTQSLNATLDAVNDARFHGLRLSKAERVEAARWITGRQDLAGSYHGMFAPTDRDFERGLRLFTGEVMRTRAGTAHVLSEEACHALIVLDVEETGVREALRLATESITPYLESLDGPRAGFYCCGKCTVAYWRHLAVGGLDHAEHRLSTGMKHLKARRQDDGRWGLYPFWYTLLALTEIELPAARRELKHAAPVCEHVLRRRPADQPFAARRRQLAERVLSVR